MGDREHLSVSLLTVVIVDQDSGYNTNSWESDPPGDSSFKGRPSGDLRCFNSPGSSFYKNKEACVSSYSSKFSPWTVRPVTHIPMTNITQHKSTGGIRHLYRILPSILTDRGEFKDKQMSTLGAYGFPLEFLIQAILRLAHIIYKIYIQFIRIPSECPKEASQTIEDFGRSFIYL